MDKTSPPGRARRAPKVHPPVRAALALLLAAVAAAVFTSVPRVSATTGALIAIDVDPNTPGIQSTVLLPDDGRPVEVDVVVQNANAIGAFEFQISFNNVSLAFTGWTLGPFLGSTGRPVTCQQIITENTIRIGCTTTGPPPPDGPSGDGVLVRLGFQPKFTGETCFPVLLVETAEIFGHPLPTTGQTGCITIVPNTPTPTPTGTNTPTPSATRTRTATPSVTRTLSPTATQTAPSTTPTSTVGPGGTVVPGTPTATRTIVPITPTPEVCPRTPDYWLHHPDRWPSDKLTLGSQTYSQQELLALLSGPGGNDSSLILAQELIAAKLNSAIGATASSLATIAAADSQLGSYFGKLPYGVTTDTYIGQGMQWVAGRLHDDNNSCGERSRDTEPTPVIDVIGRTRNPQQLPGTGASGGFSNSAASWVITAMSLAIGILLVLLLRKTFLDDGSDEPY